MTIRIVCINKDNGNHDNPHEAITRFGYVGNDNTSNSFRKFCDRAELVKWLRNNNQAYVTDGTKVAYCYVRVNKHGTEFVQTKADGDWYDNLLQLEECK